MAEVKLPLLSSVDTRSSDVSKDALAQNAFFETSSDQSMQVVKRPGFDVAFSAVGSGLGILTFDNKLFQWGTDRIDAMWGPIVSNGTTMVTIAQSTYSPANVANTVTYSNDNGVTWKLSYLDTTQAGHEVAFWDGVNFYAYSKLPQPQHLNSTVFTFFTSPTGAVWTKHTAEFNNPYTHINGFTFNAAQVGSKYHVYASFGDDDVGDILTSADGLDWIAGTYTVSPSQSLKQLPIHFKNNVYSLYNVDSALGLTFPNITVSNWLRADRMAATGTLRASATTVQVGGDQSYSLGDIFTGEGEAGLTLGYEGSPLYYDGVGFNGRTVGTLGGATRVANPEVGNGFLDTRTAYMPVAGNNRILYFARNGDSPHLVAASNAFLGTTIIHPPIAYAPDTAGGYGFHNGFFYFLRTQVFGGTSFTTVSKSAEGATWTTMEVSTAFNLAEPIIYNLD